VESLSVKKHLSVMAVGVVLLICAQNVHFPAPVNTPRSEIVKPILSLEVSPIPSPLIVQPITPRAALHSQHVVSSLEEGIGQYSASSTAYCDSGPTASGSGTYEGEVASNRHPIGTRLRITSGPQAGREVSVQDRIGSGSELDFYMGSCSAAARYGRQQVHYEVLGR